jgi:uncharacterized DUF497 family protein
MAHSFEWDESKNQENRIKHGISFEEAQHAFADPNLIVAKDITHSTAREERLYCIGQVERGIVTV